MIEYPESSRVVTLMLTWACNLNCSYCFEKYKCANKRMTFAMAKTILNRELSDFKNNGETGILKIEFFGGEPLLEFDVIKEVTEWIVNGDFGVKYELCVTTNGSLLDEQKMNWFTKYRDYIHIILSVDGSVEMQEENRGKKARNVPIDFVKKLWPWSSFKSTISHNNLPHLAEGLISLLSQGFSIAPSLAIGENWQKGDEIIYKRELEKLADWHLSYPEVEPMRIFQQPFICLLEPHISNIPKKNCGTGTTMATYDVDGRSYPCHLFLPITHGDVNALDKLSAIDFFDDYSLIDDNCRDCRMLRICKTCYGFNYKDRGDVRKRDRRACRMQLAEAQVVSDYQICWLTNISKSRELSPMEVFSLKGALRCHELYGEYEID